jgi:hypothetical protein
MMFIVGATFLLGGFFLYNFLKEKSAIQGREASG